MDTKKPTVTIDRLKWRRGGSSHNDEEGKTQLLNDGGRMCCLGFHAVQICGASPEEIKGIADPQRVEILLVGLQRFDNSDANSYFSASAMAINDEEDIDNEERERRLSELADRHGFRYVFEG